MGSKGSNRVVESAAQEVEGLIRRIYLALQQRVGAEAISRERIIALFPDYAAYLWNRHLKGDDGNVAYERVKGKKPKTSGLELGERSCTR